MEIADTFDSDNPYRPYSIPGMDDSYTSLPPIGDDKNWGKKDWLEYVVKKQLEGEYYPFQKGYDFRFEDAITRDYMRGLDYLAALEAGDMETANAIASMFEAREWDGELQEPNFTYEKNKDGKLEAIPIPGANEDKPLLQDIWDWTTDSISDAGNWIIDEQGARVDVPWAASRVGDYITDTEWDKVIPNAIAQSPEMLLDMLFTYPQLFYQSGKDALTLAGIGNDELSFEDYNIFHNKPKYKFYDEENQGPDSAETLTEEAIAMGIAPLWYRYLHNKLPTKWASRLANWAPAVHSMSGLNNTAKSKNFIKNFAKNTFGGWGSSLKGSWKGAALGWPAAALTTLFYSPPLNAGEAEMFDNTPKFEFTYDPNVNMNNINTGLIQDSDPVIFDSYMQDKIANFEPRTTAPGPRNNYQGL